MHAGVSTFHVWHDNKVTDHHSHNSTATGIYIEHVTYTTTETGMSPFNKYIFKMKGYARFHQHSAKWGQTLYRTSRRFQTRQWRDSANVEFGFFCEHIYDF